ncbi:MAG: hypothetical protein LBE18_09760 [Planctomycetaceae bacterium]|nr:hypothetical protein [Planctomycetaceae bacterium]
MTKSFQSLFYGVSFGECYICATLFYLGMSLVLIASIPESTNVFANSEECTHTITITDESGMREETVTGCPDGQICCGGSCIEDGQGCCNGTSYNTSTQGCCNGIVYDSETQGCCQGTTAYTIGSCCCKEEGVSCGSN